MNRSTETAKARVLKKWPKAKAYNRGYDRRSRCYWWQVWNPRGSKRELLGMAKSAAGAWKDATREL